MGKALLINSWVIPSSYTSVQIYVDRCERRSSKQTINGRESGIICGYYGLNASYKCTGLKKKGENRYIGHLLNALCRRLRLQEPSNQTVAEVENSTEETEPTLEQRNTLQTKSFPI